MNLFIRRLIYLSFFAVFFIATTTLILYLQGWRYNADLRKIVRTGAIMIDTEPTDVRVYLNNKLNSATAPNTVGSLAPQNYDVRLEADGYQTWRKQLSVKPSTVTFTGPLHLWPNQAEGNIIVLGKIKLSELSPNRENLLYNIESGLNAGLWVINLTSGKSVLLDRSASRKFEKIEWSPSSHLFLAKTTVASSRSWEIFDLALKTWQKLNLPTAVKITSVHWGESNDNIYFSTTDELYLFNRTTNAAKLVWRERLLDFRVNDGLVFGLSGNATSSIIIKLLNLASLQTILLEQPAALSNNLEFGPAGQNWLPLFDRDRHSLYLLHSPFSEINPIRRLPEVTSLDWSLDYKHLLINNNIEVWDYDIAQDKTNFIVRLSTPISQTRYYIDQPYIIMAIDKEIWAMELDSRDIQQRWLLAQYNQPVQDIYLEQLGKTLIVTTAEKIYSLNLMTP
ncbi:MAG: PEGA domain-containing protein [Patescibacteria group bacterium]